MLSDHERKTLREVERQIMLEDPEFARSFEATSRQPPRDRHRVAYTAAIVVALVLCVLMFVVGAPGTALVLAGGAGLIWVVRRWRDNGRRDR